MKLHVAQQVPNALYISSTVFDSAFAGISAYGVTS